ncbi:MAG TPA: DUF4349 domain-containing protein [Actinomycetota bacterium]|nr:DUF4349 domain-containing protein [Actinomycetota bacterium]
MFRRTQLPAGLVGISLIALLLFGACSGADSAEEAGMAQEDGPDAGAGGVDDAAFRLNDVDQEAPDRMMAYDSGSLGSGEDSAEGGGATDTGLVPSAAQIDGLSASIIKTADIGLEVDRDDLGASMQKARAVATRNGGYVTSTYVDSSNKGFGSISVRVPAENFEKTLGDLEALGEVTSESIEGRDVTQEFVDLEARLRNFSAQESVLLDLMSEARSVEDTIRVQRELQGVQMSIERLRGRIQYLEDQTTLSTITIQIAEAGAEPPATANALVKAWRQAIKAAVSVLSGAIVFVGFALPIAVLLALAYVLARRMMNRTAPTH